MISDIFSKSSIVPTTKALYASAVRRATIGNPPGKNKSIGDAINWLVLLEQVPEGEDIHIISEDGDFFSQLDEHGAHPFLKAEWSEKKKSKFLVYRTLSKFLGAHFDGVAFSFDKQKDALIDDLANTGSFAGTHARIEKLEAYGYFSLKEVERILQGAAKNSQFGWIVTDADVSAFLNRVAVPRRQEISNPDWLEIIDKVIEHQSAA